MTARVMARVVAFAAVLLSSAVGAVAGPTTPVASGAAQDQGSPPAAAVVPRGPAPNAPVPRRPGAPGAALGVGGATAAQAEQLFDRYVLAQARGALQLDAGQVMPFGRRLQQLQMVKRRGQRQRQQLLNELNTISRTADVDESAVAEKLKALDDLAMSVEQQVRDAYGRIDEVLNVRQRARLRIFEQRMERQKLDLIARARQAAAEPPTVSTQP